MRINSIGVIVICLEIMNFAGGLLMLYLFAIADRYRRFATATFLTIFVPTICMYPVLARLLYGGAFSVSPGSYDVISEPEPYLVFQLLSVCVLVSIAVFNSNVSDHRARLGRRLAVKVPISSISGLTSSFVPVVVAASVTGVWLFLYSTGMPLQELLVASRFQWYDEIGYSSALFVASTYLTALSVLALTISMVTRRYAAVAVLCIVLAVYLIFSKDRKFFIYILSSFLAYQYWIRGGQLKLTNRQLAVGSLVLTILLFWQIFRDPLFLYFIGGISFQEMTDRGLDMALILFAKGDLPYFYNASVTALQAYISQELSIPLGLIRRQLLFFLPVDFSFGLKIKDISAIFSDYLDAGDAWRGGNMPPGFYGLLVLSFGIFGASVSVVIFMFLLRCLDRFVSRGSFYGFVCSCYVFCSALYLMRGDDSTATYFPAFAIVVAFTYHIVTQIVKKGIR